MSVLDFSPLYRSAIGFDNLDRLFDSALRRSSADNAYPPYNIIKSGEDHYGITMAVAGFEEDELDVTVHDGVLVITGQAKEEVADDSVSYLHRGIAKRAFERRFQLADTVHVTGASLVNGLLHVDLVREVPEEQKPRRIEIGRSKAIEGKAA